MLAIYWCKSKKCLPDSMFWPIARKHLAVSSFRDLNSLPTSCGNSGYCGRETGHESVN